MEMFLYMQTLRGAGFFLRGGSRKARRGPGEKMEKSGQMNQLCW